MKKIVCFAFLVLFSGNLLASGGSSLEWKDAVKERVELKLPLLIVKGGKGILACSYIDVNTCNKTGEACAIVSGVTTHEQMMEKKVIKVSEPARLLGVTPGMTGLEAMQIMK